MTSKDGINWTTRSTPVDNSWNSIVWAPELGLLIAVALSGTGNRVMTSPDGINWTTRTSAADNEWMSITWAPELGLLVATSRTGTENRVMTSPDGIIWTTRTTNNNGWHGITWAPELGLLVAVAFSGNSVMTSPDGINWTTRTSAADTSWRAVTWAPELGLLVAVSITGTGNRVMTSPDGINWTTRSTNNNQWWKVIWAPELGIFVAVSWSGSGNRVMTSPDGINWTTRTTNNNDWHGITWAPELGLLVAVSTTGTGDRVMTASANTATSSILKAKEMKNSVEISNITVPYDTNYNRKLTIRGDTTITGNGIFPGKVGIGTNNPLSKLSITPYDVEPKITLWDGGGTTEHYGFGISSFQLNYHVGNTGRHVFYNGGKNGDGTELMRIQEDGKVGIGTNAPSAPLSVITSSSTRPDSNGIDVYNPNTSETENAIVAIRTNGSSGGDPYISFDVNGVAGWSVGLDNSDSDCFKITNVWNGVSSGGLRFKLNNNNQSSCIIPAYTGGYKSDWPATWSGIATWDIVCASIWGSSYLERSDDRLKNNEQPIINAIPTIMKLTPQSYLKKPSMDSSNIDEWTEEFGLIAQEVYYDAPELRRIVTLGQGTNPIDLVEPRSSNLQEDPDYTSLGWSSNNSSGLNYIGLIPWLIRGMQEQQNKITELETTKEELQTLKSFLQNKYPGEL
jgi:hypothetical protein